MIKKLLRLLAAVTAFSMLAAGAAMAADLLPSTQYTITVSKVNANGTMTQVGNPTVATTDASTPPKLNFALETIPTKDDCNFIYFELKDAANTTVRQGFAPAPPEADTNMLGINELSTIQAKTFDDVVTSLGDDPIPIAYMLIILRSNGVTEADIPVIANMASTCITGTGGFEAFLTSAGVTTTELDALKSCLIYNPTAGKKTLRDFSGNFYDAVNETNAANEQAKMQQAGGFMAEIFMDAAVCAGIKPELILGAHNAAGDADGARAVMATLAGQNQNFMSSIEQAMTSFHMRIAAAKVATEYTNALNTLGATGAQVDNFLAAGQTMFTTFSGIEATYGDYFMNPEAYLTRTGKTAQTIQAEIDTAYSTAFSTFQSGIASTNAEILTLKQKVVALLAQFGLTVTTDQLSNVGQSMDFSGATVNWPTPQTVMVSWLADFLMAGGTFNYERSTTHLPTFAQNFWSGTCTFSVPMQEMCPGVYSTGTCAMEMPKSGCDGLQGGPGTWAIKERNDYSSMTPVAGYNNLMALREDISIEELNRYSLYQGEVEPTRAEEAAAKLAFIQALDTIMSKMTGTLTAAQKQAIITLLKQPSME